MSQIKVSDLTFCYEGSFDNVFEHVSFQIDTDWRLGLIGRNGKGKTTLLRLLQGQYEYSGQIKAGTVFTYFPYEVRDKQKQTIEVLEELEPAYELWRVCRELELLKVDAAVLYRRFSALSGGEQTKVLLALLFSEEEHFLLIDEPTNHLDMEARRLVAEYLGKKKGFLLVSHDRSFLDTCVDHILAIERKEITVMQGNFTSWQEQKERRDACEISRNQKLLKDISRLQAAADKTKAWSDSVEKTKYGTKNGGLKPDRGYIGHKSAKMMKRAKSSQRRMEEAAREKEGLLSNLEQPEELKLFPLTHYRERLIEADRLVLSYGGEAVFEELSFSLKNGEQLALTGRNGCGKTSLFQKLQGADIDASGILRIAPGLIISYVPQDVSGLSGSLFAYAKEKGLPEHLFLSLLRKLDFPRSQFEKDMETYSQGQKKKAALAASLLTRAHLYIWDEPLNYVDIFSRMQLAKLIRTYRPSMLLAEHDQSFLEEIGAREAAMHKPVRQKG